MRYAPSAWLLLPVCLILLQVSDFGLTWLLLEGGVRGDVYEANPLAQRILADRGWLGLAGFKSLCTLVALAASMAITWYRPRLGVTLILGQVLAMACVVGYSVTLLTQPPQPVPVVADLENDPEVDEMIDEMHQFSLDRSRICKALIEEECDLTAAVAELAEALREHGPNLPEAQRQHLPSEENSGHVAAFLFYHCSQILDGTQNEHQVRARLTAQMDQCFPKVPQVASADPRRIARLPWVAMAR